MTSRTELYTVHGDQGEETTRQRHQQSEHAERPTNHLPAYLCSCTTNCIAFCGLSKKFLVSKCVSLRRCTAAHPSLFRGRIRRVRLQAEKGFGHLIEVISYWRISPFKSQKELSKSLSKNKDSVVSCPVSLYLILEIDILRKTVFSDHYFGVSCNF